MKITSLSNASIFSSFFFLGCSSIEEQINQELKDLQSPQLNISRQAAESLAKRALDREVPSKYKLEKMLGPLLSKLNNDDEKLRDSAAQAIVNIIFCSSTPSKIRTAVISEVAQRINSGKVGGYERRMEARILGEISESQELEEKDLKIIQEALLPRVGDSNKFVRQATGISIGKLYNSKLLSPSQKQEIKESLLKALKGEDVYQKRGAAFALGETGDISFISELDRYNNKRIPESPFKRNVLSALSKLKFQEKTNVDSKIESPQAVPSQIINEIEIAPPKDEIENLIQKLSSPDRKVRLVALDNLRKLWLNNPDFVKGNTDSLIQLLNDQESIIKFKACELIGEIAEVDPELVKDTRKSLEKLKEEESIAIREAAERALISIGQENE